MLTRLCRRIEQSQKFFMCFRIQEKNTLIQNCLFRLTPGAVQHELRELLTAKRCSPVQHRLCLSGCPNLNNIVLSNRFRHRSPHEIDYTSVLTLLIHARLGLEEHLNKYDVQAITREVPAHPGQFRVASRCTNLGNTARRDAGKSAQNYRPVK